MIPQHIKEQVKAKAAALLEENARRKAQNNARFNPITGEGSILERRRLEIADFPIPVQYVPVAMMKVALVKKLVKAGSIAAFLEHEGEEYSDKNRIKVIQRLVRVRCLFDFCFWAALYVYIKPKGEGGEDILFVLNRPQRRLVERFENMRIRGKPIRVILLKARQWGGSTVTQIYMAWLQTVHKTNLNSLIVGHVKDSSYEVKDMFTRMIAAYPVEMLHETGEAYKDNEPKLVGVGNTGNIFRIPQRNCKIKIGTAEKPNTARGGDYNLVHLTEVGLWKETENKTPRDIVRSATSGILYRPYTMIVFESTANGTGNLFHLEYLAAKRKESQFEAVFIPWYDIDWNIIPFDNEEAEADFALWLLENKDNDEAANNRTEPGSYLYWLWTLGATLEGINWYIQERTKYDDHGSMASETPSNDIEAFTYSGRKVFPDDDIEQLRPSCRIPKWKGEIYGRADQGAEALEGLRFKKEQYGRLFMWKDVEKFDGERCLHRYLVVVDVCKGHSEKADFADILVLDRYWLMDNGKPSVVAEWHGHIDMDMLAWKAAQIAAYYDNAMLVIESNTLETNNTKGEAEYILNLVRDVYDHLYARKQSAEDIKAQAPLKYGFHTNVQTKKTIIHNLKAVLRDNLYTERCEACLDEYATYMETDKGTFEAREGYHDDRLMTRAIGMWISLFEMEMPVFVNTTARLAKPKKILSEASM